MNLNLDTHTFYAPIAELVLCRQSRAFWTLRDVELRWPNLASGAATTKLLWADIGLGWNGARSEVATLHTNDNNAGKVVHAPVN